MATVSFQLIALNYLVSNNHNKDTKTYKKIQIGTITTSPIAKYKNRITNKYDENDIFPTRLYNTTSRIHISI